jgi:hypothetical protein
MQLTQGEELRYSRAALLADGARAALGVILMGGPLLFAELSPVTLAIFGGLAALFALFGIRTALRHLHVVELGQDAVMVRGLLGGMIAWLQTDLPEPDSPTSATVAPGLTRNDTPSTAWIAPSWTRKSILRSRTCRRSFTALPR